jgi:MFS family permease
VLVGAALAPRLRQVADESRILAGSLVVTAAGALLCGFIGGLPAAGIMSFVLGATSGTSKQAFDALVQRDAPDANRGRLFARFESRFQLAWVIGAFMPVVARFSDALGYLLIAAMVIVAFISYLVGQHRVAQGTYDWESPSQKLIRLGMRRPVEPDTGYQPLPPQPADLPPPPAPRPAPTASAVDDAAWRPPPGFVSHPLSGDETVVEQPTLPLVFIDPDDDDTLLAEPLWREPGA